MDDYLVLGSGLSSLSFSALMAKAGKKVTVLEAHDVPGGFGHTFTEGNKNVEYRFNAQFHYVWDCGDGDPVNRVLKKLELENEVEFVKYNEEGFDHMRMPGYSLDIPADYNTLLERMVALLPSDGKKISKFLATVKRIAKQMNNFGKPLGDSVLSYGLKNITKAELLLYYNSTLQDVFDKFNLPLPAQTLLALQWPDFLLPPNELSFFCWVVLFDGYIRGPYYPKNHFEHVVQSLEKSIERNGGEIIYDQTVINFIRSDRRISGVIAENSKGGKTHTEYSAKDVVCNFDPKVAAQMIGLDHFSSSIRKKLDYDYSYSNFVVYGAVKDIDLRAHGFGNWNLFHTEQEDLNGAFSEMYDKGDYDKMSFAMTTPSFLTDDNSDSPEGHQLFELLTVANYERFKQLKFKGNKEYIAKKKEIYNTMVEIIERDYVPNFRQHVCFKMLGSPTTNERYCWAPNGSSYGSNMTPRNIGLSRLDHNTSFNNFYFCNASSGFAGFSKAFQTGAALYEHLSNDPVPTYI